MGLHFLVPGRKLFVLLLPLALGLEPVKRLDKLAQSGILVPLPVFAFLYLRTLRGNLIAFVAKHFS